MGTTLSVPCFSLAHVREGLLYTLVSINKVFCEHEPSPVPCLCLKNVSHSGFDEACILWPLTVPCPLLSPARVSAVSYPGLIRHAFYGHQQSPPPGFIYTLV